MNIGTLAFLDLWQCILFRFFLLLTCVFIFKVGFLFVCFVMFCRQHTVGSCFFIQSTKFCLLFGVFGPITFSVIINMVYCLIFQLQLTFNIVLVSGVQHSVVRHLHNL